MGTTGRLLPFQSNGFFKDGSTALIPPEGTVSRDEKVRDPAVEFGQVGGKPVTRIPVPVSLAFMNRGRGRYNIFCAPCHGITGYGDGMIVRRGFLAPPSFHTEELRAAPAGEIFDVITHGHGAMYSYADRVNVMDRWAIIAYIRALQQSQHTRIESLSPGEQRKLTGLLKPGGGAHE